MGEYKIDNYHFWIVSRLFEKVFPFPESCCSLFHRWSSLRIMFCKCWMLLNMSKWWVASLEVWAFRLLNWNDNTYHALNVAELISDVPTLILLASSFPKKIVDISHLSKGPIDLKQKCTQLPTPFSDTLFDAHSLGVINFFWSVSLRNHFPVGGNFSRANHKLPLQGF